MTEEGLVRREGERIVFNPNLLATLRQRELEALGQKRAAETAMPLKQSTAGEYSPVPTADASRSPPAVSP